MFGKKKQDEERPQETPSTSERRYEVLCETTPYTLININYKDEYNHLISFFQYMYIDNYSNLQIKNTDYRYCGNCPVKMDLEDNAKPYVIDNFECLTLHVPKNTVIVKYFGDNVNND
ncbi:MAG: hypothetical protein LBM93_14945 [Oscillospiraceae bacterium]|jgi:hypothetical protein|nr:hypothetical protein [Oscillospiraceae bacterium]